MKTILIIVDMQNGFNRTNEILDLSKTIRKLVDSNIFDCTISTQFKNKKNSQYERFLNWHKLINRPETDLIEGIRTNHIKAKNVYTCVTPKFIKFLKNINDNKKPEYIFIAGVDLDCCVLKIAVDLFEHNICPIILLDYCASNAGKKSFEAAKLVLSRLIGNKYLVSEKISNKTDLQNIIKLTKF